LSQAHQTLELFLNHHFLLIFLVHPVCLWLLQAFVKQHLHLDSLEAVIVLKVQLLPKP